MEPAPPSATVELGGMGDPHWCGLGQLVHRVAHALVRVRVKVRVRVRLSIALALAPTLTLTLTVNLVRVRVRVRIRVRVRVRVRVRLNLCERVDRHAAAPRRARLVLAAVALAFVLAAAARPRLVGTEAARVEGLLDQVTDLLNPEDAPADARHGRQRGGAQ